MGQIYFYAPDDNSQELLKQDYHRWVGCHSNFVAWIAPTYFHLKEAGFSCEAIDRLPKEGIVLADGDTLGNSHRYLGNLMLICAKSDGDYNPSAHIHIVHNCLDVRDRRHSLWNPYYISHWPMPGLIPRKKERGCLVENVAYIGSRSQLAAELKSERWVSALSSLGCRWLPIFEANKWNDFSQIDLIVAARSFSQKSYPNKGAIKLFNAWRAGVPAILAPESAFLAEKKTDLDFLTINSIEEAIDAVKTLKNSPKLYSAMVRNSSHRAEDLTAEKTLDRWMTFFTRVAFPSYEQWCQIPESQKKLIFGRRYLRLKADRMAERLAKISELIFP